MYTHTVSGRCENHENRFFCITGRRVGYGKPGRFSSAKRVRYPGGFPLSGPGGVFQYTFPMSICFHPDLFNDAQFTSLKKGDIFRRIRASILPGKYYSGTIDGYDIVSFRVEEDPYRPVGSLVDYLYEHLPLENSQNPDLPKIMPLLGNLTERHGNLAGETDSIYLGYLTAGEVTTLRKQLAHCRWDTLQTKHEATALVKILSIAEEHGSGLILSQN
jgi:hypothetical protein